MSIEELLDAIKDDPDDTEFVIESVITVPILLIHLTCPLEIPERFLLCHVCDLPATSIRVGTASGIFADLTYPNPAAQAFAEWLRKNCAGNFELPVCSEHRS